MDRRHIGSLEVSTVGIGCNNFGRSLDRQETSEVVGSALDAGVNFFDTADAYNETRSEEFLGSALRARRHEAVIATKFGKKALEAGWGGSAAYIRKAIDGSLRRLGTDYIDLYQLHAPDSDTPIAETLSTLDDLVRVGKIREIGCSNFSAEQLTEATRAANGKARFVSVQNQYSVLHRDPELTVLPRCAELDISFLPYWPLHNGLLTGKYRHGTQPPKGSRLAKFDASRRAAILTEANLEVVAQLERFAVKRGHDLLALAFSWLLRQPMLSSIVAGATSAQQVLLNVKAATDWRLTESEISEIDRLTQTGLPAAGGRP